VFGIVPLVVTASIVSGWLDAGTNGLGFDLRHVFLPAARDVLDGVSPYPRPGDPEIAAERAYVYSPVLAYALAPLTLVPTSAAVSAGIIGSFVAAFAVLWLGGVRDWRCYGIALMWPPVLNSAENANASLLVAAILAAAWCLRERELTAGAAVGLAVAVKTFAWPLVAWPAVLGRMGGSAVALAVALGLTAGTWALLGFAGLSDYPELVRAVVSFEEQDSYSLSGTLRELTAPGPVSRAAAAAVAAGLIGLAVVLGRRSDERRAFVCLTLAALVATPVLWQHYLVFLLLALAVARPRLSAAWLVPLLAYLAPWQGNGALWQTLLVPLIAAVVGAACLLPASEAPGARPRVVRGQAV
jgi:hypothetical protein